jgi:molecular chaperone DnaJ
MVQRDLYELLEIDRAATSEEIKRAYRRLAHQFHPDKNPGNSSAEDHFRKIKEAYETLHDPRKRAVYDQNRTFSGGRRFTGFQDPEFSVGNDAFDGVFEEIFADFFGITKPRQKKTRGADLRYNLEISLEEAAWGSERQIKVPGRMTCPVCRGSRCDPGTGLKTCSTCRGRGSLRMQRGFFFVETTCRECQGHGRVIIHPCSKCQGTGHLKGNRIIRLNIPPGVDSGTRLRLSGEGEPDWNGGKPGDLYVVISVSKHSFFTRLGNDLLCEIPLPFFQASTGAEIAVPTLQGIAHLKIPGGTVSGMVFVLKGYGMPNLKGMGRGDQKVTVRVGSSA